jgi:hypothetical protein
MKVLLFLFTTTLLFSQQAWNKKSGSGYIQLGMSTHAYDRVYNNDGNERILPREIRQRIISLYGEYGITDDWMISFQLPYHQTEIGKLSKGYIGIEPVFNEDDIAAIGQINMAITGNVYRQGSLVLAGKFDIAFDSADRQDDSGLQTGFESMIMTPSILAGFGTEAYFTSGEIGVMIFNEDIPNRIMLNGQIGKEFLEDRSLIAILSLNATFLTEESSELKVLSGSGRYAYTGLYMNHQSYIGYSGKLGYRMADQYYLWATMGIGSGKNIGKAAVLSFAFAYEF